jgi:HK97 gp10 family phage protein
MASNVVPLNINAIIGKVSGRSAGTDAEVRIAGLKELLEGLQQLPQQLEKKAIYAALGGAARVVRDRAIDLAPEVDASHPMVQTGRRKPGTIKRAIRASRSKINKGQRGLYEMIVRVKPLKQKIRNRFKQTTGRAGKDNPNDPYYWWWVEFGTSKMPAKPFLRPAFSQTKQEQLEIMRKRMASSLARIAGDIEKKTRAAA